MPDDNDRQQNQLEKGLSNSGHNALAAGFERGRQSNEGDDGKNVGTPHRAHSLRDLDGQPRVESCGRIFVQVVGRLDWFVLVFHSLKRARVRYVGYMPTFLLLFLVWPNSFTWISDISVVEKFSETVA